MTEAAAILFTALLFGGMTLFACGFAAVLFKTLPAATAGSVLRQAFPHFYLFVMVTAALAAALWSMQAPSLAIALAAVALTTWPVRQWLMPAINRATDRGDRRAFQWLHGLSVVVTLAHIVCAGWVLAQQA